ncbi:MAG TPA: hypothetical protein VHY09_15670 [Candidatus Methylacidiphilales bacterium]|jgi:hypothetical protein|nr:hypothetical protein [Candidatus Methylacidiphilales bacterium]
MVRIFRRSFAAVLLALALLPLRAADVPTPRALPLNSPAGPLDIVTFAFYSDGVNRKVVVTIGPTLQRIDEPDDRWSFLYDPATQYYTGLEHGNYTYWTFSWPEVRGSVEGSRRGEKRLQDMTLSGLDSDNTPPATNAAAVATTPDAAALATGDDTGYVWKQTGDKKRIAGLPCERWTGESVSGGDCVAWCYNGPLPRVTTAVARLRETDEPITLVPIRTLVPDFIFPVYDALGKSGLVPVRINWGSDTEKGEFRLVDQKTRPYDARVFAVPPLYRKTTLITLDGMIPEQPMPNSRSNAAPRVDHLAPTPQATPAGAPTPPGQ